MKPFLIFTFAGLLIFQSQSVVSAQNPSQRGRRGQGQSMQGQGQGGQQRQGRGQAQQGRRGQTDPLVRILDTNGDNELSKEEIAAATAVLRKLDSNSDGELTSDELRPQFGAQGNGARGNARQSRGEGQNRSSGRQSGGQAGGQRSGGGGRGAGGGGGGRDPARGDARFAAELMELDSNQDNLISSSELPEHMQEAFKLADADQSGSLDKAELLVVAAQFRRNTLSPEGENAEMKNRPTGGNQNRVR